MDIWQAFILSLVQGISEFLPISSSAHLVITREILHWPDAGVAFDAFTGLGTLSAVIVYYHKDLRAIFYYWFGQFGKTPARDPQGYARLGNQLLVATLPALLIGFLVRNSVDALTHDPLLIATATVVFAIFLGAADCLGRKRKTVTSTTMAQALLYGLAQAIALFPGTSRSGITMTAGLAMGFTRRAAARFSFLLSIPISAAAGFYGLAKLLAAPSAEFSLAVIVLSYATSAISAFICIALFLRFLNSVGMWPHVLYRLLLGAFLFARFL